jgi:hypothetical protein
LSGDQWAEALLEGLRLQNQDKCEYPPGVRSACSYRRGGEVDDGLAGPTDLASLDATIQQSFGESTAQLEQDPEFNRTGGRLGDAIAAALSAQVLLRGHRRGNQAVFVVAPTSMFIRHARHGGMGTVREARPCRRPWVLD